ncbi:protein tyrosine phosphatase [Pseudomonas purpurea]|uniref:protein-tyrosine phosphatase family protein n=1 Tax=Pseudomonas purpurea TaxID=3136737 RepID=UPI0032649E05
MDVQVESLEGYTRGMPFQNWVPGTSGLLSLKQPRVYRSSQPYYDPVTGDTPQVIDAPVIEVLNKFNIRLIVSLNHYEIEEGRGLLGKYKIRYLFLGVKDFSAPTASKLDEACRQINTTIKEGHSALIYCGYGQGRTGTMMTAWEMFATEYCTEAVQEVFIKESTAEGASSDPEESTGQEEVLRSFYKQYISQRR